jgi:hypothetical protein
MNKDKMNGSDKLNGGDKSSSDKQTYSKDNTICLSKELIEEFNEEFNNSMNVNVKITDKKLIKEHMKLFSCELKHKFPIQTRKRPNVF